MQELMNNGQNSTDKEHGLWFQVCTEWTEVNKNFFNHKNVEGWYHHHFCLSMSDFNFSLQSFAIKGILWLLSHLIPVSMTE
jgi:hypothetical protein